MIEREGSAVVSSPIRMMDQTMLIHAAMGAGVAHFTGMANDNISLLVDGGCRRGVRHAVCHEDGGYVPQHCGTKPDPIIGHHSD